MTSTESNPTPPAYHEIPENFKQIILDFTTDLSHTFPEYAQLWLKWQHPDMSDEDIIYLFKYMVSLYPERFFDIIYQNEDIFTDTETNTFFLPNVEFKMLYHCTDVTENIRQSIWKYLQLILFSVIGSVKNKDLFGESTNIFDGIDENELHEKLKMTMESLGDFFNKDGNDFFSGVGTETETDAPPSSSSEDNEKRTDANTEGFDDMEEKLHHIGEEAEKMFKNMGNIPGFGKAFKNMDFENIKKNMPDPEEVHSHLKSLFDGKIGKLAKDIAEELANDLTDIIDTDKVDANSPKDVLKQLMKNPKKMIDLVKNIGNKLNTKMKSGEISQDEIMKEASELFGKMKGMKGGNKEFDEMFKNIAKNMGGLGGMGKNAKMNTGALTNAMKTYSMRERMREKMEKKKQRMTETQLETQFYLSNAGTTPTPTSTSASHFLHIDSNKSEKSSTGILEQKDVNYYIYKTDDHEVQEKSVRRPPPPPPHHQNLEEIEQLAKEIEGVSKGGSGPAQGGQKKGKKQKK